MGAGISQLTPEQIEQLKQETPFSEEEIGLHIRRYAKYDISERGTDGIDFETLKRFPEFVGNPLTSKILIKFIVKDKKKVFPQDFLHIFALLSPRMPVEVKRKFLFDMFDTNKAGFLQYEEVFKLFKTIFPRGSLTDDQLLDLVFRAFDLPDLKTPGKVTYEDFQRLVSDGEIEKKLTVTLQFPDA